MDEMTTIQEKDQTETVKPYPGWKNAQDKVLQILESSGYGTIITNEQLLEWFYMEPQTGLHTNDEYASFNARFYNSIDSLKDSLRENHCVCISNERGVGYEILHPDDQVRIEAKKQKQKAFNNLEKEISLLTNIRHDILSSEVRREMDRELANCFFMARNKKLPCKKIYKETEDVLENNG